MANSVGYFSYDLAAMAYFKLLDRGMLIHHTMCIVGMYVTLTDNVGASYAIAGLYVTEISNPIMHFRMMVKHLGKRNTKLYEVAELSYILLYIYGRIIIGTTVAIKTTTCAENNMLTRIAAAVISF